MTYREEQPGKLEAEAHEICIHRCHHGHVCMICV